MIRKFTLAALVPALLLSALPATAMGFDLPNLVFPPAQASAGSTSGR